MTAKAGVAYSFIPNASDADQDDLTFAATGLPAWLSIDPETGALSGMPADTDVGQTGDIELSVSDGKAENGLPAFRIQVAARDVTPPPPNTAPKVSGNPSTMLTAGQLYIFIPVAVDDQNDTLTWSITSRPSWAAFDTKTGQLSGTPSSAGTYANIRITVSDGRLSTTMPAFSIQVLAAPPSANTPPVISGSPGTAATVGVAYSFKPSASDANNDTLRWSIQNKPAWASFNTSNGQLSGTPTQVGTTNGIIIAVNDGKATSSLSAFSIVVSATPNRAPTISGTPTTSVQAGQPYSFRPTAADADKDALSFSVQNKPGWATFSIATGQLSGTPTAAQAGTYSNIVISVSDGKASAALSSFSLTVSASRPPTISGTPATTANAGTAYSFTPSASDPDGNTLTFSITNKPSWATFNTATGKLSGTPSASDAGTTSGIVISVSDGTSAVSLAAFSINVTQVATGSATIGWTPPTANTDGSTLSDLAGFRIQYGTSSTNLDQVIDIHNPGVTSYVVGNLTPATWYFVVKAYTADGDESAASTPASKTIR